MDTCEYCQRSIVVEGKSIHYCIERKKVGRKTISVRREYVAHYDGRHLGDFPHHLAAETALDEYVYDLCEQGLIDTLPALTTEAIAAHMASVYLPNWAPADIAVEDLPY